MTTTPPFHIQLFTLFPEMFPGSLGHSLAGKALEKKLWSYEAINIRDYAEDKHKKVDAPPYGGGAGMVMRPDIVAKALDQNYNPELTLLYPSPRGELFTQKHAFDLANGKGIAIVSGRFEGLDQRFLDSYPVKEVSIGDYILSGGEVAATVIMDACLRLIPGVIGNEETLTEESFSLSGTGLLEYPLYTEPRDWRGMEVPETLLSGHHANIKKWRLQQAENITKERRPDMWCAYNDKKNEAQDG